MFFGAKGKKKDSSFYCYHENEPRPRHRIFSRQVNFDSIKNLCFQDLTLHRVQTFFEGPVSACGKEGTLAAVNPAEKPILLYVSLLKKICTNGTLVSITAGSFSSVIAASLLGWDAIGFEKVRHLYHCGLVRLGKSDVFR